MEPEEVGIREARLRFGDLCHQASAQGRITWITSRGRRIAAVVPLPQFDALDQIRELIGLPEGASGAEVVQAVRARLPHHRQENTDDQ